MSNTPLHAGYSAKHLLATVREYVTHWVVVGGIIALTGFGPEHWFADVFHHITVPDRIRHLVPSWLDVRAGIVCVGVAIIVADVLFRRKNPRLAQISNVPSAPSLAVNSAPTTEFRQPIVADDMANQELDGTPASTPAKLKQEIQYCRAPDGVRLAWAKVGHGPPLVRVSNWLSHLEYEWENALRRQRVEKLAMHHTVIRYDARGNGLSDWDVDEISLDAWVRDLETVVDAAGVKRFPLLALSQGCAVAVAYAVRHPERVSHLVLFGGFVVGGKKRSAEEGEKRNAMVTLMRLGWGADDPGFRQLFTSRMMPEATKDQADSFNELQRRTTSPECAARYFEVVGDIDISNLLEKVTVPTLVMHLRGDLMNPFEEGRRLAAGIPGSRFVSLQGNNHFFLPGESAAGRFVEELELFLSE